MLVLTRRVGESIRIGDVKVTVESLRYGKVRLGVEAPVTVPVHREEVYQAIQRNGGPADGGDQTGQQVSDAT